MRIERYEIERRLGGGGMAEVFLARLVGNEGFSRPVAIKRVLAHLVEDAQFVQMFVSEAKLCAKLQHPNIVSVVDFDRDESGRSYLVLELIDGPSLADLAAKGPLPAAVAIHVGVEILRALAYAHDVPLGDTRGLVHRDISPHNVLLSNEGAVKLSDFGIAKARTSTNATASELLKGKPSYMSPEQANGEPLDGRSDLFSVGIVLWELLVGHSLFSGQTTEEMLSRVLFAPIPSPRSINADVPADLDRAVMHLLERERDDRPASASAAIEELVACKAAPRDGRAQLLALLGEASSSLPLGEAPTARSPAGALPKPRARRRRSRTLLIVGPGIMIAASAIAVVVSRANKDVPSTSASNGSASDPWDGRRAGEYYPPDHAYAFTIPKGWHLFYVAKQARLAPDEAGLKRPPAIILSPLLSRTADLPGPVAGFEEALAYELKLGSAKLLQKTGPFPTRSDFGLTGFYFSVRLDRETGVENRFYVFLMDEYWEYGMGFTASDEMLERYGADFWRAVSSIRSKPPAPGMRPVSRPQELFGQ